MSTPVRKPEEKTKVETSDSGRRYVSLREVIRDELRNIDSEKKHRSTSVTTNGTKSGNGVPDKVPA